jgi:hypothetical protein
VQFQQNTVAQHPIIPDGLLCAESVHSHSLA